MSKVTQGFHLPEKINLIITGKLLDLAETLPKFQGGPISELQSERETQHNLSKETYERTRPPEGTELDFVGFRMIEIVHYEDFAQVKAGILRLFPDLNNSPRMDSFEQSFQRFSESISWGGWMNLGMIYRDQKPLSSTPSCKIIELPPEVDVIIVGLYKSLPSLLTISFDVRLSKDATMKLRKLQEEMYLGEVRITAFNIKYGFLGLSLTSPDNAMQKRILKWQEGLRGDVEKCVRKFVSGYFAVHNSGVTKLPTIEVYVLKGTTEKFTDFSSWAKAAWHWWSSQGFNFYSRPFSDGKILFNWSDRETEESSHAHRIIVIWETYQKEHERGLGEPGRNSIMYQLSMGFLHSITTPFAVHEYLRNSISRTEKLRSVIYSALNPNRLFWNSLSHKIQLYSKVQDEKNILTRMVFEFEHQKQFLRGELKETNDLIALDIHSNAANLDNNFETGIFSRIGYLQKLVVDHINFIDKTFSTHIEFENIGALYKLQWITLLLTMVALIASIIGLAANWKEISQFLTSGVDFIKHIILITK